MKLATLKTRSEFLRVRGGVRWSGRTFLIEGKRRLEAEVSGTDGRQLPVRTASPDIGGRRFGFTVTKKLGNAVCRNRIRRRLKEAVRAALVKGAAAQTGATDHPGLRQDAIAGNSLEFDYVVVARTEARSAAFSELADDMTRALAHLDRKSIPARRTIGPKDSRTTPDRDGDASHRRPQRADLPTPAGRDDDGPRDT